MKPKDASRLVAESWQTILEHLVSSLEESTSRVDDLITLESHRRGGRSEKSLGGSLDGFGNAALDLGALSKTLERGGGEQRKMSDERFGRIEGLHRDLAAALKRCRTNPPQPSVADFHDPTEKILKAADAHFDAVAEEFRRMRVARLESGARYNPEVHDKFFENFTWRSLEPSELALCPPFIVAGNEFHADQNSLGKLIALLGSGRPLKLLLARSGPDPLDSDGGPPNFDLEMLPVSLRNAFFLQTHVEHPKLRERLTRALSSPHAAAVSLLVSPDPKKNGFRTRAEEALSSRAHPDVLYDPDGAQSFVSRFDLSENPALDRTWPESKIAYRSDRGEAKELERPYTFADYAAGEPGWKEQFSEMPADLQDREPVPLDRYLELPAVERAGRIPFIHGVGAKEQLIRIVPSRLTVKRTEERAALWRTLREFAGAANPHVKDAERKLRSKLAAEKDDALKSLRQELEGKIDDARDAAVVDAMRGLARKLAGIDSGPIKFAAGTPEAPPAEAPAAKPAQAVAPAPAPAPAGPADVPWIESKRCTTCDECININKKIFAYNADKQAYVADPKAGPFKDIVKAAQKCSAKIIHPGKPQNSGEKDLEKWIEKAAPYQ
jgi:pyruvate-ferredoxin/flavodoxin oxidoreductase